jgi:hypothetical protein
VTIAISAAVIEGVVVEAEPVVSGVECEAAVIEGAEIAAEAICE